MSQQLHIPSETKLEDYLVSHPDRANHVRLLGMLLAYYPNVDVPDNTVIVWTEVISGFDMGDCMEAARILGASQKWVPKLSELVDVIIECRNDRLGREPEQAALPAHLGGQLLMGASPVDDVGVPAAYPEGGSAVTITEYLATRPEMVERVRRLGWWGRTLAGKGDQPLDRVEEGRLAAQAAIEREATTPAEGAERPPSVPTDPRTMLTACGERAGTEAVWDKALEDWVCPTCGSPIAEGCVPARAPATSGRE
jgi:hypothetical protein